MMAMNEKNIRNREREISDMNTTREKETSGTWGRYFTVHEGASGIRSCG